MTDLLTRLQDASEGSRELDAEIALRVRFPEYRYPSAVYNRKPATHLEAFERLTLHIDRGEMPPHYTTSIDAALPWENIVLVSKIHNPAWEDYWNAIHRNDETGALYQARGATEALARRIAALQAQQSKAELGSPDPLSLDYEGH